MSKFFLIPAIVLLVCCVSVGAFNLVSGENNRPMTLYESLQVISSVDISIDDMSILIASIQDVWIEDTPSTYPSPGGGEGGGSIGGRIDTDFGEKNYNAHTGQEWLDNVLNSLSNFVYTLFALVRLAVLVVKDSVSVVATLFDLMVKFLFGVPI